MIYWVLCFLLLDLQNKEHTRVGRADARWSILLIHRRVFVI